MTRQISGVYTGNPSLNPETSISSTAGIIFAPTKEFDMSVDAYKIRYRNVVASPTFTSIINASCPNPPPDGGPDCPSTAQVLRDPTTNQVVSIQSNYTNIDERRTSGVDLDLRYRFPVTAYGKFTTRANFSYIHTFTEGTTECVSHNGCTYTVPRIRGTFSVDYDNGPVALTARMNYVHGWYEDLNPGSYSRPQPAAFQNGTFPIKVPNQYTYDLFGSYQLTKNFKLSASVVNVFNKMPPYEPAYTLLYDNTVFDGRARQVRVSLGYKM